MGFYDDLKKPVEKAKPMESSGKVLEYSLPSSIAHSLCAVIRENCSKEKKAGKRRYHGYCSWHEYYDSDYQNPRRTGVCCYSHPAYIANDHFVKKFHTQYERDRILPYLRDALVADGFPDNVIRPCDYGGGLFSKPSIYTIEVDVCW